MTPVMQIQSQMKANKLEIQSREAQIARLEAKVNQYQARLNATPGRQQELSDIMRNYDESKKSYDDLLGKTMASSLATSLNRQQQGDQFRIIDPPSLPEKASFPDRFKFSLAGLGAGLALAFVFGVGMEFVDDRIRSEHDLLDAAPLPVLAEIPPLPDRSRDRCAALETMDRSCRCHSGGDHYPHGDLVRLLLGIRHVQTILRAEQEPVRDQP